MATDEMLQQVEQESKEARARYEALDGRSPSGEDDGVLAIYFDIIAARIIPSFL
jgi:hypothetical protein